MSGKTFAGKSAVFVFGVFALIGMLIVGGIAGAAFAGRDHKSGHFAEHLAEKLSLDDAQQKQLRAMLSETREKRGEIRAQTNAEIRAVFLRDEMNKDDALQLMQLRRQKREEMRAFVAEKIAAFHSGLNPAQREKLAEIAPRVLSRLAHRGDRKHRRHHGRKHRDHDDDDDRHHDHDDYDES